MMLLNLNRRWHLFLTSVFLLATLSGGSASADVTDLEAAFKITGRVADIADTASSGNMTLQVGLHDIQYDGQVERTLIEQKQDGGVTLWLELRNVNLTVQRTEISAPRRRAECGPLQISLADRRTVWIAFDATLSGEQNGTQVNLAKVRFELPDDNWNVGSPAWVKTSGIGMSEALVVNGLRSGLRGKRAEMEAHIYKAAPTIFQQTISYLKQRQTADGDAVE